MESYGQSGDILKLRRQATFYRQSLQLDTSGANSVARIQNIYKTALYAVIADTSMNEAAKRLRIAALMDDKNRKLRQFLTPAQQEKVIPGTERRNVAAGGQ